MNDETIVDYGLRPRYRFPERKVCAMIEVGDVSHPCGDQIQLYAEIDMGIILDIGFDSHACCMTTALMDILCDRLMGQVVEAIPCLTREEIVKVEVFRSREGCIKLPFDLLKALYAKAKALRSEGTRVEDSTGHNQVPS